jgi:hypothetical protein
MAKSSSIIVAKHFNQKSEQAQYLIKLHQINTLESKMHHNIIERLHCVEAHNFSINTFVSCERHL